jgi:4'-phosphopantetheinyl transferase
VANAPLPPPPLREGEVHLHWVCFEVSPERVAACRALLSDDERARADRFHFERDRRRFTAGRAALRERLGAYLGCPPQQVRFGYADHQKPFVPGAGLQFNFSNSDERGLLALGTRPLGVDLEKVREDLELEAIADRFFAPPELQALLAAPPQARPEVFFTLWTRKEAFIKALGDGLSAPLHGFEVMSREEPGPFLRIREGLARGRDWSLVDVPAEAGWRAALACEGAPPRLWIAPEGAH